MSDPNRSNLSPRFASDDAADDLLADILESTAAVASAEQQRLERSIREQREEAAQRSLEAEQQRLAERRAKLDREMERQAKLAERRTQQMKALAAPGTSETPKTDTQTAEVASGGDSGIDEEKLRRKIQDELREEFRSLAMTPVPQPAATRSVSANQFGIFAIAAMLTLASVAGAAMMWIENSYSPDRSSYAKAMFAPADRNHLALEVGHRPLPVAEPAIEPEPEAPRTTKPRRVQRPAPAKPSQPVKRITDKPKQNANSAALDQFGDMFGSSVDPFTVDED